MQRVTTIAELRGELDQHRRAGERIGLVPTMGFLHEGHLALVRRAAELSDVHVVSIFVNPTQFAPGEDLEAYPRDLAGDEAKLAALGEAAPDYVFAPNVEEMYPSRPLTTVHVDRLTDRLCGASRPTHFDGVATVVTKLFGIVQPDVAVFGRKDFQQLRVIQRLAADLNLPVDVVGGPTVREPDGVAMSSRNTYLDQDDRKAARALSRALRAAVVAARHARERGDRPDPEVLYEAATITLAAEPRLRVDYVDVLDADTLTPPDLPAAPASGEGERAATGGQHPLLVAIAAYVGPARLIDNVVVGDHEDEDRLLEATGSAPPDLP